MLDGPLARGALGVDVELVVVGADGNTCRGRKDRASQEEGCQRLALGPRGRLDTHTGVNVHHLNKKHTGIFQSHPRLPSALKE